MLSHGIVGGGIIYMVAGVTKISFSSLAVACDSCRSVGGHAEHC